jgi:hypothetical protein
MLAAIFGEKKKKKKQIDHFRKREDILYISSFSTIRTNILLFSQILIVYQQRDQPSDSNKNVDIKCIAHVAFLE